MTTTASKTDYTVFIYNGVASHMTVSQFCKTSKIFMRTHLTACIFVLILALIGFPHPAYAVLTNGNAAIDILGQFSSQSTDTTPTYFSTCAQNGPGPIGMYEPTALAMDTVHHRLFLADSYNNRVLVYTLTTGNILSSKTAANVIGQASFQTCNPAATATGMNTPVALSYDSTNDRLFVEDWHNNRVLVFSTATITNGMAASYEIGQPAGASAFTTAASATSQSGLHLYYNGGLLFDSTTNYLYVTDASNNRIMIFDATPANIANGENALFELGQPSGSTAFTSATAATSQSGLSSPCHLALDTTNKLLYVADYNNYRVMVFHVSTITNGMNATYELGQASGSTAFTTGTAGAVSASTFPGGPSGLAFDQTNSRLFVLDDDDNRILVFSTSAIANGMSASYVFGQSNFTNNGGAASQAGLDVNPSDFPGGIAYDSTNSYIYIADSYNNRVVWYNAATGTIANGANAVDEIGQYTTTPATTTDSWTNSSANAGPNPIGFFWPGDTALDPINHRLFAMDTNNDRVLVFALNTDNSIPTAAGGHTADYVIGQTNLVSDAVHSTMSSCTASTMYDFQPNYNSLYPSYLAYDQVNNRLFVTDKNNNRVLVFNTSTISNGMSASYVLGQTNLTTCGGSTPTAAKFKQVSALAYDSVNNRLFVTDMGDNRVLIFSTSTITNGESASFVLGQTSLTATAAAGTTATQMNGPTYLAYDPVNSRLFVSDTTNNRVLVFSVVSGAITNGQSAIFELGQPSGTAFTSKTAATTATGMSKPEGLAYDSTNSRLFLADNLNDRILVYNVGPSVISNGESASFELGQAAGATAFTTAVASVTQSQFPAPYGLSYSAATGQLYLSDGYAFSYNRILIFDATALTGGFSSFMGD